GEAEVVERWRTALRTLGAVSRGARVDESRVAGAEGRGVEAEARRHALSEVLHEDIRTVREAPDDLHALRLLQIDRQALLVAVVRLEVEVRTVREVEALRAQNPAARITLARLDLDHLRAEVAEHHRGDRSLLPDRPIDHADALERERHARPIPQPRIGRQGVRVRTGRASAGGRARDRGEGRPRRTPGGWPSARTPPPRARAGSSGRCRRASPTWSGARAPRRASSQARARSATSTPRQRPW